MPTQVGEQNRFGYTWDGVQWQAPAASSSGAAKSGPPPPVPPPDYGYGNRYGTTTPKGLGFLGPLQRPDGSAVMSEYSIGTNIDGKETEIPSLVPTLSRDEVQAILTSKDGQPVARSAIEKAVAFARQRIAAGKDPFAQTGEQQSDLYPDLPRAATPPVRSPAPDQGGAATKVGEQNRFGYTWDGGRWQAPTTAAPDTNTRHRFGDLMRESGPSFGQMELPPTVPGHVPPDYEGLRQALTISGMLAGSALMPQVEGPALLTRFLPTLLRVAGASAGGATGRVAASGIAGVPEGSSVGGEAAQGAIEGGVTESLPVAAAPLLRGGGRLLRAVGGALDHGINIGGVSAPPWLQTGAIRTLLTHVLGGGSLTGDLVGTVAPKAAEGVGHVMDRTGTRMGGRTTTELVEDGLTALARRTGLLKDDAAIAAAAAPTRAERVAAGAERYAGARRANAAQQAAREAASGLPPDLGEQVPVTTHRTVPQPDVDELRQATGRMDNERQTFDAEVARILARPREEGGLVGQGLRPAGPPAPPERSILDSLRQRSGTSVRPGDAPPPPAAMPPLTVPEPPAGPPPPRAGRTGTGFTMAAPPPLDIPEPMPSHTVVRSSPVVPMASHPVAPSAAAPPPATTGDALVQNLEARTTGRAAPPARPTAAPWLDLGRARIAELEAGGVADTDPALQRLRQTVADVEAEAAAAGPPAAAAPRRGPTRGAGGRYGPKLKPTE